VADQTLPPELDFPRPDDAERYRRAVPGYMKRIRDLYEAIQDRFGEAGLELIREVSRSYGERIAANVRRKGELRGVAPVGRYLLKVFDMVSDDWEVSEHSEDRMVIRVHRCPYPFTRPEICAAHTCMEEALVTSLDPDLTYRIGCSLPKGDDSCEHILERRSG
jgi:hypothetical protein